MCNTAELYYLECKQELDIITTKHNDLLCRISGVTDTILQEQLSEEYIILDEQVSVVQAKFNEAEKLLIDVLISDWYAEYLEFYRNQFTTDELITCIEKTNNIKLSDELKRLRIRIPKSIDSKRELYIIASSLNKKISILSYDGYEIDYIGTKDVYLNLYVDNSGKTAYPKALA